MERFIFPLMGDWFMMFSKLLKQNIGCEHVVDF